MANQSTTRSSTRIVWGLIVVSALLFAAQLWIVVQWAVAASGGNATAVADFRGRLPGALSDLGVGAVTWFCVLLAAIAATAAFVAQSNALGARRTLSRALLAANGLLLIWYAFTMM